MTGGPVSWSCKHQSTIATSFTKAKYIGQYNATQENVWIRSFLKELGYQNLIKKPLVIKADNIRAEALSQDSTIHSQAKHLDVAYHWQRQQVERKALEFKDIPSRNNKANSLIKFLVKQFYRIFKDLIHINEI